ncbi:hypothetical protein [Microbacterium aurantiacum]|uniref:hypothetical protein n=1 Tax=Microbacterium aurantiacum TaxID=162393 RepID=UPI000C7FC604|nr:hypothetical protein [Microbacterium aurantiacum]
MTEWVAVSFGALDMRGHELGAQGYDLVAVPIRPGTPHFLFGHGTDVWLRLVAGPVQDGDLTPEEREIVRDMEQMGIASRDPQHPARIREVNAPWMSSMVHELVYALLGNVAARNDIDLIFLKGPTLHAQGLRRREHSGDVDCWVAPGNDSRLARAMEPWGWVPAFSAFTGTRVLHSLTLRAGEWGCAVDVHSFFPGMAVGRTASFATALSTSDVRAFAGQTARTPSIELHAIISALNEIRPFRGQHPGAASVRAAAHSLSVAGEATIEMAKRVGAEFALKDSLVEAFPEAGLSFEDAAVPEDWSWRLQTSTLGVYYQALKLIPWRDRVRVLSRVVWPSAESLRSGPVAAAHPDAGVWKLRALRVAAGLRQLRKFRD